MHACMHVHAYVLVRLEVGKLQTEPPTPVDLRDTFSNKKNDETEWK